MIARLLLWNLADSKTTLAELRTALPALDPPDAWLSNEATERFGLVSFAHEPPRVDDLVALIGKQPDWAEEFDVE